MLWPLSDVAQGTVTHKCPRQLWITYLPIDQEQYYSTNTVLLHLSLLPTEFPVGKVILQPWLGHQGQLGRKLCEGVPGCCTHDRVQRVGVALEFARRSSRGNIWKAGGPEEQEVCSRTQTLLTLLTSTAFRQSQKWTSFQHCKACLSGLGGMEWGT